MIPLFLDTETYSETPIRNGTYRYAEDCEVMIVSWALGDGALYVEDLTAGYPSEDLLALLMNDEQVVVASNAMFDRNVLRIGHIRHGAERSRANLAGPIRRWRCAMVQALAHALPGGLDKLCGHLKIPQELSKQKDGRALVHLFCKPRPVNSKLRRATRETHPAEWARFLDYAGHDVLALREVWKKLPTTNMARDYPEPGRIWHAAHKELALWHLDQEMNDRGFQIDHELVRGALAAIAEEQASLAQQVRAATGGAVQAATQRDKLLAYLLAEYGLMLPNLTGDTLNHVLDYPDIDEGVKELIRIRQQASKASTAKYRALARATSADGALRGTVQFDGAGRTRRAAGRVFQPHNLPSRGLPPMEAIEAGVEALKQGTAGMIFPDVMALTSATLRGAIVSRDGHKLVVSDLANIEGRDSAWLVHEHWKIKAFQDFDAGTGPDLYRLAFARAFAIPHSEVTKDQRQVGKVLELFMQYEGGVGAFVTGAATYGIDLDAMARAAWDTFPADVLSEARDFFQWWIAQKNASTYGLSEDTFVACDVLKRLWRRAHPATVSWWKELLEAVRQAVRNPGAEIQARRCWVVRKGAWLRICMPSGRALCYPSPQVTDEGEFSYMGIDQYRKTWSRIKSYGGKLHENLCQSFARDIMFDGMFAANAAGYLPLFSVHDEVVTETEDTDCFSEATLSRILATPPSYAPDMPLAAKGFEARRYRKD